MYSNNVASGNSVIEQETVSMFNRMDVKLEERKPDFKAIYDRNYQVYSGGLFGRYGDMDFQTAQHHRSMSLLTIRLDTLENSTNNYSEKLWNDIINPLILKIELLEKEISELKIAQAGSGGRSPTFLDFYDEELQSFHFNPSVSLNSVFTNKQ